MMFQNIGIIDENFKFQPNRFVCVEGKTIVSIDTQAPPNYRGACYDGRNKVLTPAFFNSHGHTPMVLLRGYGENMVLQDWLEKKIYPYEAQWNGDRIYWATLLGIAEMLQSGTVSVTDMYLQTEAMARAFLDSGAKVNLDAAIVCFDGRAYEETPEYEEQEHLFANFHNRGDGRIKIDVGLHAEYTSTPKIVSGVAAYAMDKQARIHVHLSETEFEHREAIARRGKTATAYFEELGLFENPVTAAHCVWVDEGDMDILAAHDVTVASCPVSNMKLASGFMPVKQMLQRDIRVALGTDGASSNNNLDMVEEMKFFSLAQKGVLRDPTVATPAEAMRAATVHGALGQGRDDTGVIAVGKRADLAVFDLDRPHLQPVHDVLNQIVYAANGGDVILTMADGEVLYRDGQFLTIDIEKVIFEAQKANGEILNALTK